MKTLNCLKILKHMKVACVFTSIILLLCLISSQETSFSIEDKPNHELNHKKYFKGREIFINSCSTCHIGFNKDDEFYDFNKQILNLSLNEKSLLLQGILIDSFHSVGNIPPLTRMEIKRIIYFIENSSPKLPW